MSRIRETMTRARSGASLAALVVFGFAFAQSALAADGAPPPPPATQGKPPATAPAADQTPSDGKIEKVTVTAQRREQQLKDVPIAVTAIGNPQLKAKQIEGFADLQFQVPSVTFSKGNFGGNNFQIRGIGVSAVSLSADTGVSVHQNDIYLVSSAGLSTAEYYDLDRIEVLRGPQSTLFGRNATGGAVNVITAKPDLTEMFAFTEGQYGTYGMGKIYQTVNLPIVDGKLGLRVAGFYGHHDGFVENLYTHNDVDSENQYSVRASLRWEPFADTVVDFMASYDHSDDSHMRSQKQLCHRDTTGVLGCLPDKLAFEPLNGYATFGTTLASKQFWTNVSGFCGGCLSGIGIFDLQAGPGMGAGAVVPKDLLQIYTDFDPKHKADGRFYSMQWEQDIRPWLSMNLLVGHESGHTWSQENYNQALGDPLTGLPAGLANLAFWSGIFHGNPAYFAPYQTAYFSSPGGNTVLPLSCTRNNGIVGGCILQYSGIVDAFDQSNGSDEELTSEIRFASNFDGPINFLVGGFYLDYEADAQYWVNANTLDYSSIALGAMFGPPVSMLAPPYYLNDNHYELRSTALFGEAYWEATDDLSFTFGLRWVKDKKHTVGQQTILSTNVPIGTLDNNPFLAVDPAFDADPSQPGNQLYADQRTSFEKVIGRFVAQWKPDLDFTDDTMIYASYSRGFKSGGVNPPLSASLGAVPQYFAPEIIDSYEIGTKNTLLNNTMSLNLTGYYYEYNGYQVSEIINRTSVNDNINATLYGAEGELLWRPDDHWQFNVNVSGMGSSIAEVALVDQRNPGNGDPNAVIVKDVATGANCVVIMAPAALGVTPADAGVPGFYVPAGGSGADAAYGVPHVNFGSCTAALPANYAYSSPNSSGIPVSLKGNELPQAPNLAITIGVQYTLPLGGGYDVVPRVDFYWQSRMWTRIFNDANVDEIPAWDVLNAQIQLNAPGQAWYAKVFATNIMDERNMTNSYLTDASSGLFTNVFVEDPRIIGVAVGANY